MMRRRQAVAGILLAILMVLVAVVVLVEFGPEEESEPSLDLLWDLSMGEIEAIAIQDRQGEVYRVAHDEQGSWIVVAPIITDTDQSQMVWLTRYLIELHTVRRLGSEEVDRAGMGLITPTAVFTLTLTDGQRRVLQIGSLSPRGVAFYIEVDGEVHLGTRDEIANLMRFASAPPVPPSALTPRPAPSATTEP